MEEIKTIINSPKGREKILHHFIPTLSLGIALEQGLPIKKEILDKIYLELESIIKEGYVRWNEDYPEDYDDTIIVRKVFDLLEKPIKKN